MRKQTQLVAVLSAAALLAIGASMTSFAATGWAEESGTWVYYDKNGDRVTDEWKKSGNNWFYLDDQGEMAIDELIEDDDNYFYVDATGAMVANQWVAVENENGGDDENEPEEWWYYFQANGKAYAAGSSSTTTSTKTINGKKYIFDDEAHMLFGWINENYEMMNDDDGAFADAKYYCGDSNDGAVTAGWVQLSVTDDAVADRLNDDDADEDQTYWFYFNTTGKKAVDTTKTINSQKYYFDTDGVMTSEWAYTGTPSSTTPVANYKYYSDPESGARVSKGWFQAVPDKDVNKDEHNDDSVFWFYAKSAGELARNEVKTINSKKYAFNNAGEMINGLQAVYYDAEAGVMYNKKLDEEGKISRATEVSEDADALELKAVYSNGTAETIEVADAIAAADANSKSWYGVYYFGTSDDGAAKTGTNNLTVDGDSYTFNFKKDGETKGRGVDGISDKAIYQQGKKLKADKDNKYEAYYFADNGAGGYTVKYLNHSELVDMTSGEKGDLSTAGIDDFYTGNKVSTEYKGKILLVNTSGALVKSKSSAKDGDDWKFTVNSYAVTNYVSDES